MSRAPKRSLRLIAIGSTRTTGRTHRARLGLGACVEEAAYGGDSERSSGFGHKIVVLPCVNWFPKVRTGCRWPQARGRVDFNSTSDPNPLLLSTQAANAVRVRICM